FPATGAQGAPYNTRVIVSLPEPVNPASVGPATAQVLSGGASVTVSRIVSADGRYLSLRGSFQPSTQYAVSISGLRTPDNRAIPAAASTFTTGAERDNDPLYPVRSLEMIVPVSNRLELGLNQPV